MNETLKSTIDAKLKARDQKGQLRRLTIFENENLADFSSNDSFRFRAMASSTASTSHSSSTRPAMARPAEDGQWGRVGSRLLDGNSVRAERLERETLPQFHGAPDGLLFGSGFDANVGVYSSLAQPGTLLSTTSWCTQVSMTACGWRALLAVSPLPITTPRPCRRRSQRLKQSIRPS